MKTNLKLIENITENIKNENWSDVADDISLISQPKGYLRKIANCLQRAEDDYYPKSQEDEQWIKSVAPLLVGEYACGNI